MVFVGKCRASYGRAPLSGVSESHFRCESQFAVPPSVFLANNAPTFGEEFGPLVISRNREENRTGGYPKIEIITPRKGFRKPTACRISDFSVLRLSCFCKEAVGVLADADSYPMGDERRGTLRRGIPT